MPTQLYASVNGTRLCYFERGERTDTSPSLLFAHCTGFHARVWDFIIDRLPTCIRSHWTYAVTVVARENR